MMLRDAFNKALDAQHDLHEIEKLEKELVLSGTFGYERRDDDESGEFIEFPRFVQHEIKTAIWRVLDRVRQEKLTMLQNLNVADEE